MSKEVQMTVITFRDEPWTIVKIPHNVGTYISASNLIQSGRFSTVLMTDHIYNWKDGSQNYAEAVHLTNKDKTSEIMHSGYARPKEFPNPEWNNATLEDFYKLLLDGKKNPLFPLFATAKMWALAHLKNAPLPEKYADDIKKIFNHRGFDIMKNGMVVNKQMIKIAREMQKNPGM